MSAPLVRFLRSNSSPEFPAVLPGPRSASYDITHWKSKRKKLAGSRCIGNDRLRIQTEARTRRRQIGLSYVPESRLLMTMLYCRLLGPRLQLRYSLRRCDGHSEGPWDVRLTHPTRLLPRFKCPGLVSSQSEAGFFRLSITYIPDKERKDRD